MKLGTILKLDWILLVSVFLLLGIGLLSLYSISSANQEEETLSVFARQCIFAVAGIVIMSFFIFFDYHYLRSYSKAIYFMALSLLVLVLLWGSTVRGTVGWIGIGTFHIQPVEIAKLALVIFLASFISQKKMELGEVRRLIVSLILAGIMVILVLRQPDLGSAAILGGIWLGLVTICGIKKKLFIIVAAGIIILAFASWAHLADYQKARIVSFIQPESDPQGSGYNVIQSKIAIGSGGITGKGIGHGSQSQLNFIPERHNDFIFAVIAEEWGLLGALLVIFLFIVIFYRARIIACRASDNFGYLLAAGIMVFYFLQVIINIGMNVGIVPVAGISLPFLSYGGSFLIISLAALGILLNVGAKRES